MSKSTVPKDRNSAKAYLYLRCSTHKQTAVDKLSLQTQRASCEQFATENGLRIIETIEDVGSASRFDRLALYDLIERIPTGSVILTYSISRASRDMDTLGELFKLIRRRKLRLIAVSENVDSENGSVDALIKRSILGFLSMMESKQISQRVKDAMANVQEGRYKGRVPYGFAFKEGAGSDLVLDPKTYLIVERIRKEREAGISVKDILRRLNADKIASPSGKRGGWNAGSIYRILDREDDKIPRKGRTRLVANDLGQALR